jgi:hypothetical protein
VTDRIPPRMASWLLRHLGPSYGRDSLAGDLFEEYQAGKTRAWYWRQVLAAAWIARTEAIRIQWRPRAALSALLRFTIEVTALIGVGALSQQHRLVCPLGGMSRIASLIMLVGSTGLCISIGLYLLICALPRLVRSRKARRSPPVLKKLIAVFAVTALSTGTLTWAGADPHNPRQCIQNDHKDAWPSLDSTHWYTDGK